MTKTPPRALHRFSHSHNRHSNLIRHSSFVIRISLLLLLTACQAHNPPHPAESWIRTDLYFGLTRRDSSLISDADFQAFIDSAVTPAFPDGFTLTPAAGQYLDSHKLLHKEPSRILTLLYPKKDAAACNLKINALSAAYCQQFNQESVLRTDTPAQTQFLSAPH